MRVKHPSLISFPTRRSSDLRLLQLAARVCALSAFEQSDRIGGTVAERVFSLRRESLSWARQQQPEACCEQENSSDRKSTRLNSSHLVISYAVFCLKKKTTEI